jgi:pimeloyl-ACP methyl ester carboxylesterase
MLTAVTWSVRPSVDVDTVHDAAARVVAGIAGAQRVDWPDAGHLPSLEDPDAFSELLREWISRQ